MNIKKIVYSNIFLLTFFLPVFAFGAAAAPKPATKGEIPKVTPLQPAPEGVYPNVQNNIQFQDPSQSFSPEPLPQSPDTQEQIDVDQPQESAFAQSPGMPLSQGTKIFWIIFALAGVGLVAVSVFRNQKV